ncbi:MAG: hypothetical protein ABR567_04900 [Myxococcales bacterium]
MILALLLATQTVAVLEFRDKVPREQRIDAAYLSDQVRSAVKELLPSAKVITRENMLVLLEASGKKLEECEGECEVDTGRRIGADLVVSGELLRFGSQYKLNMKLHDTRSGELISGTVASGATADELDSRLRAAVGKLLSPLMQNEFPDRRAEAQKVEENQGIRPALSAHAVLGFGTLSGDSRLIGLTLTETRGSESALTLGLGADAGVRLGRPFSLGLFVDYAGVQTQTSVNALVYGLCGRFYFGQAALALGAGLSHLGTNIAGPGAMAAFDYVIYAPFALHTQALYAHESDVGGLFNGANSVFSFAAGVSAFY